LWPGFGAWVWFFGEFLDWGEVAVGVGVVDVFDGGGGLVVVAGAREVGAGGCPIASR
jgi:hypothetical protein